MRVAVLGAGGPAGVSALRALKAAGHDLVACDSNRDHLAWCARYDAELVHMEDVTAEAIDALHCQVALPQPDTVVAAVVADPPRTPTLIPSGKTVRDCQDKYASSTVWWEDAIREHPPLLLEEPWPDHLHLAADRFGLPFWLRARSGAGAKGAILVRSLEQGYHWIRFWQSRGEDWDWIAEEHLPGKDFAWSSIWYDGDLITSFVRERLEYLYPHLTPEGLTGTPTIARIVHDEQVNDMAQKAVLSISGAPHGIFSVDLKGDSDGTPRPTEINAGRGFTTFGLWSLYGPNFLDLTVRLARYGPNWWLVRPDLTPPERLNALPSGLTLSRHIDCEHVFSRALVTA